MKKAHQNSFSVYHRLKNVILDVELQEEGKRQIFLVRYGSL